VGPAAECDAHEIREGQNAHMSSPAALLTSSPANELPSARSDEETLALLRALLQEELVLSGAEFPPSGGNPELADLRVRVSLQRVVISYARTALDANSRRLPLLTLSPCSADLEAQTAALKASLASYLPEDAISSSKGISLVLEFIPRFSFETTAGEPLSLSRTPREIALACDYISFSPLNSQASFVQVAAPALSVVPPDTPADVASRLDGTPVHVSFGMPFCSSAVQLEEVRVLEDVQVTADVIPLMNRLAIFFRAICVSRGEDAPLPPVFGELREILTLAGLERAGALLGTLTCASLQVLVAFSAFLPSADHFACLLRAEAVEEALQECLAGYQALTVEARAAQPASEQPGAAESADTAEAADAAEAAEAPEEPGKRTVGEASGPNEAVPPFPPPSSLPPILRDIWNVYDRAIVLMEGPRGYAPLLPSDYANLPFDPLTQPYQMGADCDVVYELCESKESAEAGATDAAAEVSAVTSGTSVSGNPPTALLGVGDPYSYSRGSATRTCSEARAYVYAHSAVLSTAPLLGESVEIHFVSPYDNTHILCSRRVSPEAPARETLERAWKEIYGEDLPLSFTPQRVEPVMQQSEADQRSRYFWGGGEAEKEAAKPSPYTLQLYAADSGMRNCRLRPQKNLNVPLHREKRTMGDILRILDPEDTTTNGFYADFYSLLFHKIQKAFKDGENSGDPWFEKHVGLSDRQIVELIHSKNSIVFVPTVREAKLLSVEENSPDKRYIDNGVYLFLYAVLPSMTTELRNSVLIDNFLRAKIGETGEEYLKRFFTCPHFKAYLESLRAACDFATKEERKVVLAEQKGDPRHSVHLKAAVQMLEFFSRNPELVCVYRQPISDESRTKVAEDSSTFWKSIPECWENVQNRPILTLNEARKVIWFKSRRGTPAKGVTANVALVLNPVAYMRQVFYPKLCANQPGLDPEPVFLARQSDDVDPVSFPEKCMMVSMGFSPRRETWRWRDSPHLISLPIVRGLTYTDCAQYALSLYTLCDTRTLSSENYAPQTRPKGPGRPVECAVVNQSYSFFKPKVSDRVDAQEAKLRGDDSWMMFYGFI